MTGLSIPDDSLFGPDNLPFGIFSTTELTPRAGVRFGDHVLDLGAVFGDPVFTTGSLNAFMSRGPARWAEVRERLRGFVGMGEAPDGVLHAVTEVRMHLPFEVADYVDFYASEHHAVALGRLFRPNTEPLLPNWKHLPVGYHGRAGTVVVSGTDIVRPEGQRRAPGADNPEFGPSTRLDIEAELGFVVGVPSTTPIGVDDFAEHVFGAVIVNDWSARDIQAWEYVPLGPFLGKSFATSISPWVVPLAALSHAWIHTPPQLPVPLPYLRGARPWGLDVDLEVRWNGERVSRPPYGQMYWSPAQMLAHLTVNGATARTGDLFASGTISGAGQDQRGSFIELTSGGARPIIVRGETRTFLEDGDEIVISADAPGPGNSRIGFGEVRGRIVTRA